MINVLNAALSAVSGIQKTVTTTIYNKVSVINDGIASYNITNIQARVHAQPLTMKELETFQTLEKSSTLDFFKNQDASNSIIIWDNDEYSIYGKIEWQNDSWIKVYGIKNLTNKRDSSPEGSE